MARLTFGIVGGTGWLGGAIARSMLEAGFADASHLIVSSRSGAGLPGRPDIACVTDNEELTARADVIVLSVRPTQFAEMKMDASGKLLVSVMAGVPVAALAGRTGAGRIVRAMPNAAAAIRKSYTPWFASEGASAADKALVRQLLATCGTTDEVFREADIDYLTGLSGSGPAFPALLATAMIEHALKRGLPEDVAKRAVKAVITGSAELLAAENVSMGETVRTFLEYRGTTAAGLQAMIDGGFIHTVGAGLDAAAAAGLAMARPR